MGGKQDYCTLWVCLPTHIYKGRTKVVFKFKLFHYFENKPGAPYLKVFRFPFINKKLI